MIRRWWESDLVNCRMKDDYDRWLESASENKPDKRLQGLSEVGIDYPCSGCPLGGSKTRMESSASKDTPCPTSGAL